jgi:pyridoxal biosynthesis lyase PdxS
VVSLGGEFVKVDYEEEGSGGGGYAKVMSEGFQKAQREMYAKQAREVDIIITTALIPGKPAPRLITAEMVQSMKPGSVIVDMAAERGGNCELTEPGKAVVKHGVTIIGYSDLNSRLAKQSSTLYATNLFRLTEELCKTKDGVINVNMEDDSIRGLTVVKEGGITFGCSMNGTFDVVSAVKKATRLPVIPKLTPNVTDVASIAKAAEDAGADAVSLVNTFLAMAIDVETRRPKLSNIVGGLSGPAIRPIAVRMVYECRRAIKIPIVGMGGIATADDVLEFMIAGANAVQVGTMNFVDPFIWTKLMDGIRAYMTTHKIVRLQDVVGTVDTSAREKAWLST